MIQKIDNATVREAVQQAYERCKNETGGKNADYIPYLANVQSNLFGIAACLPDGDVVAVGDTDYKFGIESVSKVPTAILAMNQYGGQEVLGKIGADATGLPFNSIMAILLENDHPSTPLVNAGAISACSMIKPVGDSDGKWKAIVSFIADLAGSDVAVIDELYKSETATNFNNKSIAWLLKNYNRIYDDPDMALDIYTRQCSIGVTARQLATMAATIANSGVNPVTGKAVFKPELTPKIASMMATVGFYEHTGDWLFTTGLPAKTGVGGGIVLNGKLLCGCAYGGAELGHMVIEYGGRKCTCGRNGCFEAYSSATALVAFTKECYEKTKSPIIEKLCSGDVSKIGGKTAFAAMRAGDKDAEAVVDYYIKHLACGVANLINIFQPDVLLIGGGVCNEGDNLLIPLKKEVRKEIYSADDTLKTDIRIATLGNDAGIIGAAALARNS